jgi:hypothetical protein
MPSMEDGELRSELFSFDFLTDDDLAPMPLLP